MALITANGVAVLRGTISMPLYGVWIADLVIDQSDNTGFTAGTEVSIVADDGITLNGTVEVDRTADFIDAVHLRILGGSGGMLNNATPAGYSQPSAFFRDVFSDLCKASKETASTTIDPSILGINLTAWSVQQNNVSSALDTLLKFNRPTAGWRILADGTLWVGEETWPAVDLEFVTLSHDPAEAMYEVGCDSPSIYPGITISSDQFGDIQVNRVEHIIEKGSIRSQLFSEIESEDRGIRAAITEIIHQEIASIDYFTLYDALVVSQSSDMLSVDVRPYDMRLSGLTKVPLRHGLPGVTIQINPGAIIRVGWDRGNPSLPYAALFQGGETAVNIALSSSQVMLGDNGLVPLTSGIVQGSCIDTFTGATFGALGQTSTAIMAKKI